MLAQASRPTACRLLPPGPTGSFPPCRDFLQAGQGVVGQTRQPSNPIASRYRREAGGRGGAGWGRAGAPETCPLRAPPLDRCLTDTRPICARQADPSSNPSPSRTRPSAPASREERNAARPPAFGGLPRSACGGGVAPAQRRGALVLESQIQCRTRTLGPRRESTVPQARIQD